MQQEITFSSTFKTAFGLVIVTKIVLLLLFSSGYQETLFFPFITSYLEQGGNPWEYTHIENEAFPYPPLMLYILSIALSPIELIDVNSGIRPIALSLLYGIPLLISDLAITAVLIRMYLWHKTEIFFFYICSPIIIYSTYMHGQLDIIPTALLFVGVYLLSRYQYLYASILIGCAISAKFHTIAALPILVIYLFNQGKYKETLWMLVIPITIFFILSLPYLVESSSYWHKVVQNQKQSMIFASSFTIGSVQVYLPLLVAAVIYLRFSSYQKINQDLLNATLGVLFSTFLLLIEASPAWYIWMMPFITIFYIRYFDGYQHYFLYSVLVLFYLIYYVLFFQYDYSKLIFLGKEIIINLPNASLPLNNIVFTVLQAILLATIYQFYKAGIQSNNTYERQQSFIIGIGGDSGSGKSTLIRQLKSLFNKQLLELEGDGDHKWERDNAHWQEYTHLDPKANALHKQADQVQLLKNRKSIKRSDYNHGTGKFTELDTIRSRNFIVLAGLHPFYLPKMRKIIDFKIFMDLDERLRTSWKILRDNQERGYSAEQVLDSLDKRQVDSSRYIQPQKRFCDLIVSIFPAEPNKFHDHKYTGRLGLAIEMNASIPLDRLIQAFQNNGCELTWDYSEDLSHQLLRFDREPKNLDMNWFANTYITNASELIDKPNWQGGFEGITQFLIIYAISEIMKERGSKNV